MKPNNTRKRHRQGSRGVALVTTLLMLSLFTVMTLAMVIATSSDLLIDGYYRNLRGSFYAADSGLNAARQYLVNQLFNNVTPNYPAYSANPPIPVGTEATIMAHLGSSSAGFGGTQSTLSSSGPQASSWPGSFTISYNAACATTGVEPCPTYMKPPTCTTVDFTPVADLVNHPNVPTCTSPGDSYYTVSLYTYAYSYKITAVGNSIGNEQNSISEWGTLLANVAITGSHHNSFADYGTFFNSYALCSAGFVKGTMSGPFFSNDSWNFGDSSYGSGNYIFTGTVGAVNPDVGYMYGDGTCDQSNKTSDTHNGTTIAPTFQAGLNLNQKALPLPTDSFSQSRAVLDGVGEPVSPNPLIPSCGNPTCPITAQEMNADHLTNAAGTVWPATGTQPISGVYLPYTTVGSVKTFTGGGIFVQGNANQIVMTAATVSGHSQQVFTITQGTTITTVTLDLTGGSTSVSDNQGHSSGTIMGLPENLTGSQPSEAAMLYVNGAISGTSGSTTTGLTGPASGAAIQNGSAVTVTATGNVAITGNLLYSTEPVTLNAADTAVSPAPTNVLGIFTTNGDIQLQPTTNVSTMEIDASLAMVSTTSSGGLIAQWNTIGTVNIVGGRIAMQAKSGASIGTRNIYFDQRFANGFAPPWFPSTTVVTNPTAQTTVTPNRISWTNTTAQ